MKIKVCFIALLLIIILNQPALAASDSTRIQLEKNLLNEKQTEIIVQYKNSLSYQEKTFCNSTDSKIKERKSMGNGLEIIQAKDSGQVNGLLEELKKHNDILYVERNKILKTNNFPNDPYYQNQWGLNAIMAESAWDMLLQNQEKIIVGVIDSGIEKTHYDLASRIAPGGYNFLLDNNDVYDLNGHGTEVAGIIAAETGNGVGIAGVTGKLDVKILPLLTSDSEGDSYLSDVIEAIDYAIENKVDILNLSMGSNSFSNIENAAIQRALQNGIVVVASAGNDGTSAYTYPASYDNVISVGSIDRNLTISDFSNYNDRIDVVAPGEDMYTTGLNNSYSYHNGTSFSAPMVAGIAAVIKAINPTLTPAEIESNIKNNSVDLGTPGQDIYYGHGLASLYNSVKQLANVPVSAIELDKSAIVLKIGESLRLNATIYPSNASNKNISWVSDNSTVASISVDGTVTGLQPGSAVVIVITEDGGKMAICNVTVEEDKPMVTEVSISKQSITLELGKTELLTATVYPLNAANKKVSWATDKSTVATVAQNGLVTAVAPGIATIIAITEDGGKIDTCRVQVVQAGGGLPSADVEWREQSNVSPSKIWTITFNAVVDTATLNSNNVYVTDTLGGIVPVKLFLGDGLKSAVIMPPEKAYTSGQNYYLYINKNLSSKSSKLLGRTIRMKFRIK